MRTPKIFRLSREAHRLFFVLLTAVLILWGINARVCSYHKASTTRTAPALFDQDEQKAKAGCDKDQGLFNRVAASVDSSTSLSSDSFIGDFSALRNQQVSGPVRSALPFYSSPTFFRPPHLSPSLSNPSATVPQVFVFCWFGRRRRDVFLTPWRVEAVNGRDIGATWNVPACWSCKCMGWTKE